MPLSEKSVPPPDFDVSGEKTRGACANSCQRRRFDPWRKPAFPPPDVSSAWSRACCGHRSPRRRRHPGTTAPAPRPDEASSSPLPPLPPLPPPAPDDDAGITAVGSTAAATPKTGDTAPPGDPAQTAAAHRSADTSEDEDATDAEATKPPDPWATRPIVAELQFGAGTPIGLAGLAIDYSPVPLLALNLGVGLGLGGAEYAFASRLRVVRAGRRTHVAVSLGGGLSGGAYNTEYAWPPDCGRRQPDRLRGSRAALSLRRGVLDEPRGRRRDPLQVERLAAPVRRRRVSPQSGQRSGGVRAARRCTLASRSMVALPGARDRVRRPTVVILCVDARRAVPSRPLSGATHRARRRLAFQDEPTSDD